MKTSILLSAVLALSTISTNVYATTVKQQLDAVWANIPSTGVDTAAISGKPLLAPTTGTTMVDITMELTNFNTNTFLLCTVNFTRFLARPVDGPTTDQWYIVTPYHSGQQNNLGGTASVTRTFAFNNTAKDTGVGSRITCRSNGGPGGNVRIQVKSVFTGND